MNRVTSLFLSIVIAAGGGSSFVKAARAEEMWLTWANYRQDGNPIYLAHREGNAWRTRLFPGSNLGEANFYPSLGISPQGNLWLVWAAVAEGADHPSIYYSLRTGERWNHPRKVEDAGRWDNFPSLAFEPSGNPLLAWSGRAGASTEIFVSFRKNGDFLPAVMVSTPDRSPDTNPSLSRDNNGSPVVVWEGWRDGHAQIFRSSFRDGSWGEEELLQPEKGVDQILPAARRSSLGRLVVSWTEGGRVVKWEKGSKEISPSSPPPALDLAGAPQESRGGWLLLQSPDGSWGAYRARVLLPSPALPPRRERAAAPPGKTTFTEYYIGYGDSITYGHNSGSDGWGWYGYLLKALLGGSDYFYNKGYPGATTYDMLYGGGDWNCPGIDSILNSYYWANYILIMGGTNDLGGAPPSDTKSYLGTMIDRARETTVEPVLATILPRWCHTWQWNASSDLSNNYIPSLAMEKNCPLADPYQIYMYYYRTDFDYFASLYENDNTHPSWPDGDQKIAAGWYEVLAPSPTPSITPTPSPTPSPIRLVLDSADYNGDGTSDLGIFRPASGLWAIRNLTRVYFGTSADIPANGDYDGDGTTDLALFRPSNNLWAVRSVTRIYFGSSRDLPVPGDYNGDGSCEVGIYRPSSGFWAIQDITRLYFGGEDDIPVPGYYDIPHPKRIAIFRPSNGLWAIHDLTRIYFGRGGDRPVPANYEGGSQTWEAIFRASSGLWSARGITRFYFGRSGDREIAGDYNGDGTAGGAVFRPGNSSWFIRGITRSYFGRSDDITITGLLPNPSSAFLP